jgi:hypothetical protein
MIDYFMIDDHLNCVCSLWVCIKAKNKSSDSDDVSLYELSF